jgi:rubredoxin
MSDAASSRIAPETRMECGVCWHVYDPADGDPVWQIEPGVAFADLPAEWRCPECDAPQERFLSCDHER